MVQQARVKDFFQQLLGIPDSDMEYNKIPHVRPDFIWQGKYAFEVQHSPIKNKEYLRRNAIYRANNFVPIWIFHQKESELCQFKEGIHGKSHPKGDFYQNPMRLRSVEILNLEEQDYIFYLQFPKSNPEVFSISFMEMDYGAIVELVQSETITTKKQFFLMMENMEVIKRSIMRKCGKIRKSVGPLCDKCMFFAIDDWSDYYCAFHQKRMYLSDYSFRTGHNLDIYYFQFYPNPNNKTLKTWILPKRALINFEHELQELIEDLGERTKKSNHLLDCLGYKGKKIPRNHTFYLDPCCEEPMLQPQGDDKYLCQNCDLLTIYDLEYWR